MSYASKMMGFVFAILVGSGTAPTCGQCRHEIEAANDVMILRPRFDLAGPDCVAGTRLPPSRKVPCCRGMACIRVRVNVLQAPLSVV